MGLEVTTRARLQATGAAAQEGEARVLLETDELILRGGVRARVPRSALRDVRVSDGTVVVQYVGGTLRLMLGVAASKFAAKLVERPRTRLEKMGIATGVSVALVNLADPAFAAELRAAQVNTSPRASARNAVIVLGVHKSTDITRIARTARLLADTGALWVVHPKGIGGVRDTDIFAAAKRAGLTYTKVARFSDTHTAEKLVVRVAARAPAPRPRRVIG